MIRFRKINKMTTGVRQELETLQRACLPEDTPVFPEDGTWWVGHDGSQAVAFCLIEPSCQWLDTAYLARSGVLKAWRGQGLQKKMITIRERHARSMGYRWMISDTTDNPPSSNSLMAKGYRIFDPSKPWGMNTTLYWRKRLRED
jgi:GNAT superfamily N-acetyltransferase